MHMQRTNSNAEEGTSNGTKGDHLPSIAANSDAMGVESPNQGRPRSGKIPTLRIPLGYLHGRTIREAAVRAMDPNALAFEVMTSACGLRNPPLDGGVDLVLGDKIHPQSPLMIISGSLVAAVKLAARKHGTCASRFVTWRLALGLDEPYQRSVFD